MWEEVVGEDSVRTLLLTGADWEDKEMVTAGPSGDCDDGGDVDEQLQRGKWGVLMSYFLVANYKDPTQTSLNTYFYWLKELRCCFRNSWIQVFQWCHLL